MSVQIQSAPDSSLLDLRLPHLEFESLYPSDISESIDYSRTAEDSISNQFSSDCTRLSNEFHAITTAISGFISGSNSMNAIIESTNPSQLDALLQSEVNREFLVEQGISGLKDIVAEVEGSLLNKGKQHFQSATGLLDTQHSLMALLSGTSGLVSFSAAAYLALSQEHTIIHGCHQLAEGVFGKGTLTEVAFAGVASTAIFVQGLAILAGSLIGPSLVGFAKTVGGRVLRNSTEEGERSFKILSRDASLATENYQKMLRSLATDIGELQPALARYYSENEKVRLAISAKLLLGDTQQRSSTEQEQQHTEIHKKSSALGASELITMMRSLNLERTIRSLAHKDFRSPELLADHAGITDAHVSGLGILRGLRWAGTFFTSLFTSSTTIGRQSALGATQSSHELFEHLPQNTVSDVVSGVGSGLSSTLQLALETATRPDKTAYAMVKGVISTAKSLLVGGVSEGPRLETFLKVIFELDELERGNRLRWFSKLIPCVIRAVTQKPALMARAEQIEEMSGNVSPKSLLTEMAERQGRWPAIKKMVSELTRISGSALSDGIEHYLIETPLKAVKNSSIIEHCAPKMALWAKEKIDSRHHAHHQKLQSEMDQALQVLTDSESVRALNDSELDIYAIQKYIEFSYRPEANIQQPEIAALLHYWTLRRKESWHETKDTEALHLAELGSIHPDLKDLHLMLRSESGLLSRVAKTLIYGKSEKTDPSDEQSSIVKRFFDQWSRQPRTLPQPATPIVLDCSRDGMLLAILEPSGNISLRNAGEIRSLAKPSNTRSPLSVIPHAEYARIATCEMLLASKLEPFQSRALLEAHYQLIAGEISNEDAIKKLSQHHISREQLIGRNSLDTPDSFIGLISLGIIGQASQPVS